MKVNNAAGAVTNALLLAMGGSAFIGKDANTAREWRRMRERQRLRAKRTVATSIPIGKGFK